VNYYISSSISSITSSICILVAVAVLIVLLTVPLLLLLELLQLRLLLLQRFNSVLLHNVFTDDIQDLVISADFILSVFNPHALYTGG